MCTAQHAPDLACSDILPAPHAGRGASAPEGLNILLLLHRATQHSQSASALQKGPKRSGPCLVADAKVGHVPGLWVPSSCPAAAPGAVSRAHDEVYGVQRVLHKGADACCGHLLPMRYAIVRDLPHSQRVKGACASMAHEPGYDSQDACRKVSSTLHGTPSSCGCTNLWHPWMQPSKS